MSDLRQFAKSQTERSQLPVSWYFDQRVFELEQKLLFADGPGLRRP